MSSFVLSGLRKMMLAGLTPHRHYWLRLRDRSTSRVVPMCRGERVGNSHDPRHGSRSACQISRSSPPTLRCPPSANGPFAPPRRSRCYRAVLRSTPGSPAHRRWQTSAGCPGRRAQRVTRAPSKSSRPRATTSPTRNVATRCRPAESSRSSVSTGAGPSVLIRVLAWGRPQRACLGGWDERPAGRQYGEPGPSALDHWPDVPACLQHRVVPGQRYRGLRLRLRLERARGLLPDRCPRLHLAGPGAPGCDADANGQRRVRTTPRCSRMVPATSVTITPPMTVGEVNHGS